VATQPPTLRMVRPGQLGVRPIDACAAPGGIEEWLLALVAAAKREPLYDVVGEAAALVSQRPAGLHSIWDRDALGINSIATKLARVRYRFAAIGTVASLDEQVVYEPAFDAPTRPLWEEWRRKQIRVAKLARQFQAAEQRASDAWIRFSDAELNVKKRSGRPAGQSPVPETTRALLRIFRDLFGTKPTDTLHGPTVRFITEFFKTFDGTWLWVDATQFEPAELVAGFRVTGQQVIPPPRPSNVSVAVRHAIEAQHNDPHPQIRWETGSPLFPGCLTRHGGTETPLNTAKFIEFCGRARRSEYP